LDSQHLLCECAVEGTSSRVVNVGSSALRDIFGGTKFNLIRCIFRICGTGTPDDTYSCRNLKSGNTVVILFDASDTTVAASSGFNMSVSSYYGKDLALNRCCRCQSVLAAFQGLHIDFTAVRPCKYSCFSLFPDGCIGNPCRGARCLTYPGSSNYTCLLQAGDMYCGFENSLSNGCRAVRTADLYDDYKGSVAQISWEVTRTDDWSIGTVAPQGTFYLSSYALYNDYYNGSKSYGTFRIIPVSFATDRCLRFKYYLYGDGVGSLLVFRAVNGSLGSPIFSQTSTTALNDAWMQAEVTVPATGNAADLIEVSAAHLQ